MIRAEIKNLRKIDYQSCYEAMKTFTLQRDEHTSDEIWYGEHKPVYTNGLNGQAEHLVNIGDIPLVNTDRGGQVTFHGPGQLMIYPLVNIKRLGLYVKNYVNALEQSVIDTLQEVHALAAHRRPGMPGVYIDNAKVAALGIRVKRHCAYHGVAINLMTDLHAFEGIHPCGYQDLQVTSLEQHKILLTCDEFVEGYLPYLAKHLGLSLSLPNQRPLSSQVSAAR